MKDDLHLRKERFNTNNNIKFNVWNKQSKKFEDAYSFLVNGAGKYFRLKGNEVELVSEENYIFNEKVGMTHYDEPLFVGDIVLITYFDFVNNTRSRIITLAFITKSNDGQEYLAWTSYISQRNIRDVTLLRKRGTIFTENDYFELLLNRRGLEESRIVFPYSSDFHTAVWNETNSSMEYVPVQEETIPAHLMEYYSLEQVKETELETKMLITDIKNGMDSISSTLNNISNHVTDMTEKVDKQSGKIKHTLNEIKDIMDK